MYLVDLPGSLLSKNAIRMAFWLLPQRSEYHLVKECFITHPVPFSFVKNSFLFDRLNQIISRVLESGLRGKLIESSNIAEAFEDVPLPTDDQEPRPYSLNDLQIAFIGPGIGLFLSFLLFDEEMLIEDFESLVIIRHLRRVRLFFQ